METSVMQRWYFWLVAAAVLLIIGFGALAILGDGKTATGQDDTSLIAGLAWLVWLLSWIGSIVSVVIAIAKGIGQARAGDATADS
jgi:4-amino-4-deoxy-L-arabinose transferase-like glycosyltransferase